ncbi:MAG: T9SS C-terminal target domain-containing protein [Cytophagales bacterium]|nr:MAG: T9SS C-terminal target domain-containing protein [Cytophagales bacterium]TAF60865.1 MAG: T9SS C-terminal target domain-containing protein [Cytophagales bacterium]
MLKKSFLGYLAATILSCFYSLAHSSNTPPGFEQNTGHYPNNVIATGAFKNNTNLFLEKDKITYTLIGSLHDEAHEAHIGCDKSHDQSSFSFQMNWLNSNKAAFKGIDKRSYQVNRISENGAFSSSVYNKYMYSNIFPDIDFVAQQHEGNFKYDYVVNIGGDPNSIKWDYKGVQNFEITSDGRLKLFTPLGSVVENKPLAYQVRGSDRYVIECTYVAFANGSFGFDFPNGYDKTLPLVIDPTVEASTLMGSFTHSTNAFCSDYDASGNIYAAGRAFGPGYPTTIGALQSVVGGQWDACITKLNPTGTAILYSTYLGGSAFDEVHSITVRPDGSVYVLGITASTNFPTRAGAFDATYNGGSYDYFVSRINSSGSVLINSTFLGGNNNDGENKILEAYGDEGRADIFANSSGVWLCGTSFSPNFPTTVGSYQTVHGGGQDGVVVNMSSTLGSVLYGTFIGGAGNDGAYDLLPHTSGNIYVCGSVASAALLPLATATSFDPTYNGGRDGFIGRFNGTTMAFNASYWGTSSTDQLLALDQLSTGEVYAAGASKGTLAVVGTTYSTAGTQALIKLAANLNTMFIQTSFGTSIVGSGYNFNTTAFMVDDCERVILVGATGVGGSLTGLPLTPGFLDSSAGFYMAAFLPSVSGLQYGSYYGGASDHSHPGQGRFDKNNLTLYQTSCTPVGAMFPTLPGSVASTQVSTEMGVFKIRFGDYPSTSLPALCVSGPASDLSTLVSPSGGVFSGSGMSGTMFDPAVSGVGTFTVTYTYTSPAGCTGTTILTLTVTPASPITVTPPPALCTNSEAIDLNSYVSPSGGVFWGVGVTGTMFFDPATAGAGTHTIGYTTTSGCSDTVYLTITVEPSTLITTTPVPSLCLPGVPLDLNSFVSPSGGIFAGPGVSGSIFDPTAAGLGTHTVSYTIAATCPDTAYLTIVVGDTIGITTTAPPALCAGGAALDLNSLVSPSGGIFSGVGVSGSLFDPSVSGVGTFTVSYTYTSPAGCTGGTTLTLVVSPVPVITVTGPMPIVICQNATPLSLLSFVSPNTGTFTGSGLVGSDFDPQLVAPGTYPVLYQYTDCATGCGASATLYVQVVSAPSVSIAALPRMCSFNPALNLSTYASPAGGTFSGAGVSGTNFDPAVAGSGTHLITYTYTDPTTGCTNSVSRNITVNASGSGATFSSIPDVCVSLSSVDLSLFTSLDGGTFAGPGVTGSVFSPAAAGVGTHTISYVYGSPSAACLLGCGDTLFATVTVRPAPTAPQVSSSRFICLGTPGTFIAFGSGSGVTYEWYNAASGGTLMGTGPVLTLPTPALGTYMIWVQATVGGCTSPRTEVRYVVRACSSSFKVSLTSKGSSAVGVVLAAESNIAIKQGYVWLCNGDTLKTQAKALLEANKSGFYQVMAQSEKGELSVSEAFEVVIATDTKVDRSRLVIYPNPNQGAFSVAYQRADLSGKVELAVIDMNGREVYKQSLEALNGQVSTAVSVSFLPSGTYAVRLSGQGVWAVEQFVKQ